jgi:hypothetical protein
MIPTDTAALALTGQSAISGIGKTWKRGRNESPENTKSGVGLHLINTSFCEGTCAGVGSSLSREDSMNVNDREFFSRFEVESDPVFGLKEYYGMDDAYSGEDDIAPFGEEIPDIDELLSDFD